MKRSRAITLVLLGGGAVLTLGGCGDSRQEECERARRELRPDAEQICARAASSSSGYRSSGSSWFFGRGSDSNAAAQGAAAFAGARAGTSGTASSRGGFGGTASASGSGS
jgi:hypothetical protein